MAAYEKTEDAKVRQRLLEAQRTASFGRRPPSLSEGALDPWIVPRHRVAFCTTAKVASESWLKFLRRLDNNLRHPPGHRPRHWSADPPVLGRLARTRRWTEATTRPVPRGGLRGAARQQLDARRGGARPGRASALGVSR